EGLVRVEADELHLAREACVLQRQQHARRGRLVAGEESVEIAAEAVQQVLRRALGGVARGARVLVGGDQLEPGPLLLEPVQEAALAVRGAGRALGVAQQQRAPLAVHRLAERVGGEDAALVVVGGDEAHDLLGGERGVEDDRRYLEPKGLLYGPHERLVVERREHDAVHALGRERLDHLDLLLAVVFPQRAFPRELDVHALGREVALGAVRARVDRAPELVGLALRDHRDPVRVLLAAARALAFAAGDERQQDERDGGDGGAGTRGKAAQGHLRKPSRASEGTLSGTPLRVKRTGSCPECLMYDRRELAFSADAPHRKKSGRRSACAGKVGKAAATSRTAAG